MGKKRIKGQATIFIIIGIIILILVFTSVYIGKILTKEGYIKEKIIGDPVKVFVEQCVETIAKQGLVTLGKQGGYIYLELYDTETAKFTPFNSEVLVANPFISLPYWFYQKEGGMDRSEMPKLEKASAFDYSIQDQLERYVTEELPNCLNNFEAFTEKGMTVTPTGDIMTDVLFTTEDTSVTVTYPLSVASSVASAEETKILDKFSSTLPVRMAEIYSLAKDIAEYESQTAFLEQNTMNLITLYGENDANYLPPTFGGMEIEDCGKMTYWMEEDVYKNFKEMLMLNAPYIKIYNTDFERIVVTDKQQQDKDKQETVQGVYDMMTKRVSDKDYPYITALFEYRPEFPLFLDLGSKGIIKPAVSMNFNYIIGRKCAYVYKFAYDFKYPLLVTLIDKKSKLDNQPYMFQFPLMIVTKQNFPRVKVSEAFGVFKEEGALNYCGEKQKTSGESSVTVIDRKTNEKMDDVMIYYQCGPSYVTEYDKNGTLLNATEFAERCFMGKTGNFGKGSFVSKYQPCIGGATVTAVKPGYEDSAVIVGDVYEGGKFNTVIQMTKLKEMKVDAAKYFVKKPSETLDTMPGIVLKDNNVIACNIYTPLNVLEQNEELIINLRRMDISIAPMSPDTVAIFKPGEEATMKLAPGNYMADILLMRNAKWEGEMNFKKDSQSYNVPGTLFTKGKTISYPDKDIDVPSTFTGGAKYTFTITDKNLENDVIQFNVIDEGKPAKVEEVGSPTVHRDACSMINYNLIKPVFKMEEEK